MLPHLIQKIMAFFLKQKQRRLHSPARWIEYFGLFILATYSYNLACDTVEPPPVPIETVTASASKTSDITYYFCQTSFITSVLDFGCCDGKSGPSIGSLTDPVAPELQWLAYYNDVPELRAYGSNRHKATDAAIVQCKKKVGK